jgi:predicted GIY-YIG superfamily endonuclease
MFYFHVLQSTVDHELYFGYTDNLRRRRAEHATGKVTATEARCPFRLIYYEAYLSETDARNRERQIKQRAKAHSGLKRRIASSLAVDFK